MMRWHPRGLGEKSQRRIISLPNSTPMIDSDVERHEGSAHALPTTLQNPPFRPSEKFHALSFRSIACGRQVVDGTLLLLPDELPLPYSATKTAAMPIPVPTHIELTPTFFPVRLSSYRSVEIWRAPVQPKGCPNAIAPPGTTHALSALAGSYCSKNVRLSEGRRKCNSPLGFTFSIGKPSSSAHHRH